MDKKLLEVKNIKKYFNRQGLNIFRNNDSVKAVDDISFYVFKGETLGIVGESGCGKTTLARMILGLENPTDGKILYKDKNISLNKEVLIGSAQMVFQDPYSSLNPRMTVKDIILEPLNIERKLKLDDRLDRVKNIMDLTGLEDNHMERYPHEFSGGQRQRICIARALSVMPELLVCDEPVSALDVSVQSKILNLFLDIKDKFKLTYIFISHDLNVIYHVSDRIMVMYLGKIVEIGTRDQIFDKTKHPYTKLLLDSVISLDKRSHQNYSKKSRGCSYAGRCQYAKSICFEVEPRLNMVNNNHYTACHLYN